MIVLVTTEPIAGTPAVTDDGAAHVTVAGPHWYDILDSDNDGPGADSREATCRGRGLRFSGKVVPD